MLKTIIPYHVRAIGAVVELPGGAADSAVSAECRRKEDDGMHGTGKPITCCNVTPDSLLELSAPCEVELDALLDCMVTKLTAFRRELMAEAREMAAATSRVVRANTA